MPATAACLVVLLVGAVMPVRAGDQEVVDIARAPWSSIGQVNNAAYGRCTGFLVGRARALTAAHCLYSRRTRRSLQPDSVHFVLGYERGDYAFATVATAIRRGPGFDPTKASTGLRSDWAILDLAEAAPASFAPLEIASSPEDGAADTLRIAGFARERSYLLTATGPCKIEGRFSGLLVVYGCAAPKGYSGGPLIDGRSGTVEGVVIARGRMRGRDVTLVVPSSAFADAAATQS